MQGITEMSKRRALPESPSESSKRMKRDEKAFRRYRVIAAPCMEDFAKRLEITDPEVYTYFPSKWEKFPDSGGEND